MKKHPTIPALKDKWTEEEQLDLVAMAKGWCPPVSPGDMLRAIEKGLIDPSQAREAIAKGHRMMAADAARDNTRA